MESYHILYSVMTRSCDRDGVSWNIIIVRDGSTRNYTLSGLEENSDFNISIAAENGASSSPEPARISTNTLIAGRI